MGAVPISLGHLGFYLFDDSKGNFKYVGFFDYEDPKRIILHTKLLIDNLIAAYDNAIMNTKDDAEKRKYEYLRRVSIDLTVPPFFEKKEILNRILEVSNRKYDYHIDIYYRDDLRKRTELEYEKIGELKVIEKA